MASASHQDRRRLSAKYASAKLFLLLAAITVGLIGCGREFWQATSRSTTSSTTSSTDASTVQAKFAFVTNFSGGATGTVSAYLIDGASGSLAAAAKSPFTAGSGTVAIAADAAGKFLYAVNQGGGLSGYKVDRNGGTLSPISGSPFPTGSAPVAVAVDPAARFVFVANSVSHDISAYTIDSKTGALKALSSTFALSATPLHAVVEPTGRFLYVTLGSAGTQVFAISADGSLVSSATVPSTPCAAAVDITFTPKSKLAFIADGSTGICNYAVNASSGALWLINANVISAGSAPVAIVADPGGKALFTANQTSNDMSAFAIATDGTLTAFSGSPFAAGKTPAALAVDPSGAFVYLANSAEDTLSVFKIAGTTSVQSAGTVTTGPTPRSIAVTP